MISTNKKGLLKYKVNQHVFLLLLSTLMTLYSIEYIAIILLLDKIFTMSLESAKKCKEIYSKFIRFNEELIKFINNHQFIKGFQISTKNFYKSDPRVITSIDEYINIQSNPECEDNYEIIDLKEITDDIPLVIIKPQTEIRRRTIFSEPIIDKHNIKSPNENIKKDEFFHNIFKSEYYDETQYIDKVLKPVKESSQITKKQLANAVGSDKRKKYQNPNGLKLKILMKNNVDIIKQPILCLGAPSTNQKYAITPKKNRLSILDFPMVTLSYDSNNNLKKPKTDINSVKTRERKKSMLTIKRKTNNEKNVDIDFQPDFEEAIFETFPNCYSENFKAEKIWSFKDDGNYLNTFSRSSMRNY